MLFLEQQIWEEKKMVKINGEKKFSVLHLLCIYRIIGKNKSPILLVLFLEQQVWEEKKNGQNK